MTMHETSGAEPFYNILQKRSDLLRMVRRFFYERGYIEVETANLMRTAPPDPQIDPLEAYAGVQGPFFLHTSPEMGMKKLLPSGHNRIFQICKVYRVEDNEEVHSTEFTMLEWYREGTYGDTLSETDDLLSFVDANLSAEGSERFQEPREVYELQELFQRYTGINPFRLGRDDLFQALKGKGFPGIDGHDDWNSLFFKVFIQDIEPALSKGPPYFIVDWPRTISTMAKDKHNSPGIVERFELYVNGLEIANGYTELIDPVLQRDRFLRDNEERRRLNKRTFEIDERFLEALSALNGSYTGVSVGIDRLLMVLLGKKTINEVLPHRFLR